MNDSIYYYYYYYFLSCAFQFSHSLEHHDLLGGKDASSAHRLNLLLGHTAVEPGLDDDWLLGQDSLAQHLEEADPGYVDNGSLLGVLSILGPGLL